MASDEAEVVTHAQQLLDFDWKLKGLSERLYRWFDPDLFLARSAFQYVVSSASLASVNRPLLRLELAVTTPPVKVEGISYFRKESIDEKAQIAVAEYSKVELDALISKMEAISQALESMESTE